MIMLNLFSFTLEQRALMVKPYVKVMIKSDCFFNNFLRFTLWLTPHILFNSLWTIFQTLGINHLTIGPIILYNEVWNENCLSLYISNVQNNWSLTHLFYRLHDCSFQCQKKNSLRPLRLCHFYQLASLSQLNFMMWIMSFMMWKRHKALFSSTV